MRSGVAHDAIEVSVLRYSRNRVHPLESVVGINGFTPEFDTADAVETAAGGGRKESARDSRNGPGAPLECFGVEGVSNRSGPAKQLLPRWSSPIALQARLDELA